MLQNGVKKNPRMDVRKKKRGRIIMVAKLFKKYLPIYFQFLPGYWLAAWCAPVQCEGRSDTAWEVLRITIRKSRYDIVAVIKKGKGE